KGVNHMIGYLKGRILEHAHGKMLVVLGSGEAAEPGAAGYLVFVPQSLTYANLAPGQVVELFVHSHVREDAFDLFGFSTRGEKELFLCLLSVNGIGPKGALGILS